MASVALDGTGPGTAEGLTRPGTSEGLTRPGTSEGLTRPGTWLVSPRYDLVVP